MSPVPYFMLLAAVIVAPHVKKQDAVLFSAVCVFAGLVFWLIEAAQ